MPELDAYAEQVIRETAYFIWKREGALRDTRRIIGSALLSKYSATTRGHDNEYLQDEEKILAGRPDANIPAHLTKDVPPAEPRASQYPAWLVDVLGHGGICANSFCAAAGGLDSRAFCLNSKAGATLRHLGWFEVVQIRGSIQNDQIRQYQVTVKVGFTLEED